VALAFFEKFRKKRFTTLLGPDSITGRGVPRVSDFDEDTPVNRHLAVIALYFLLAFCPSLAAQKLYFTDPGLGDQVSRINLDGTGFQNVIDFPEIVDPRALAIDPFNGKAYYSSGSALQRVNFDGTVQEGLGASGGSVPTDIALDVAGNKMYWSVDGTAGIRRAALDGSGPTTLVSQALLTSLGADPLVRADDVSGIALDVTGGRIYWANGRHLNSMPIGGVVFATDAVHQFELAGSGDLNKIKLDLDNGLVYWTNNLGSLVQRASLVGAGQTTLVSRGFGRPAGLAIDLIDSKLYFGDTLGTGGRGEILLANLDGSGLSVIYDPFSTLFTPLDVELGPETAIPEPSSLLLAAAALGLCIVRRRTA
jgi:hypothetical protein